MSAVSYKGFDEVLKTWILGFLSGRPQQRPVDQVIDSLSGTFQEHIRVLFNLLKENALRIGKSNPDLLKLQFVITLQTAQSLLQAEAITGIYLKNFVTAADAESLHTTVDLPEGVVVERNALTGHVTYNVVIALKDDSEALLTDSLRSAATAFDNAEQLISSSSKLTKLVEDIREQDLKTHLEVEAQTGTLLNAFIKNAQRITWISHLERKEKARIDAGHAFLQSTWSYNEDVAHPFGDLSPILIRLWNYHKEKKDASSRIKPYHHLSFYRELLPLVELFSLPLYEMIDKCRQMVRSLLPKELQKTFQECDFFKFGKEQELLKSPEEIARILGKPLAAKIEVIEVVFAKAQLALDPDSWFEEEKGKAVKSAKKAAHVVKPLPGAAGGAGAAGSSSSSGARDALTAPSAKVVSLAGGTVEPGEAPHTEGLLAMMSAEYKTACFNASKIHFAPRVEKWLRDPLGALHDQGYTGLAEGYLNEGIVRHAFSREVMPFFFWPEFAMKKQWKKDTASEQADDLYEVIAFMRGRPYLLQLCVGREHRAYHYYAKPIKDTEELVKLTFWEPCDEAFLPMMRGDHGETDLIRRGGMREGGIASEVVLTEEGDAVIEENGKLAMRILRKKVLFLQKS